MVIRTVWDVMVVRVTSTGLPAISSGFGCASAFLASTKPLAQPKPLDNPGQPADGPLTSITSHTVRITIQPIENGQPEPIPQDGALVKEDLGQPAARLRVFAGSRRVKCGALIVEVNRDPFTIRIDGLGGRAIQQLQPD